MFLQDFHSNIELPWSFRLNSLFFAAAFGALLELLHRSSILGNRDAC